MDPNIVILAAGISSRMKKSIEAEAPVEGNLADDARTKPKSMIGLGEGRRPFLDFLLENVREAGYSDVVLVLGEGDFATREYYFPAGRGAGVPGLRLTAVLQAIPPGRKKPLGTADALLGALRSRADWRGKKFTVCNSDNLYSVRALRLLLESPCECALIDYDRAALEFEPSRFEQFSVLEKDSDGCLTRIIEKPSAGQIAASPDAAGRIGVSMNIFRLSYDLILPILGLVPLDPLRAEKELPAAVMMLVERHPKSMAAIPLSEHVPDLTYQSDIVHVQEFLKHTSRNDP
jgi:NDP-sugar pyrophosphorylase family protein